MRAEKPQVTALFTEAGAAAVRDPAVPDSAGPDPAVPDSAAPAPAVPDHAVPGHAGAGSGSLPVLPALAGLLPAGLPRGSVIATGAWSLLCLALAAAASGAGAWCAIAGLPALGVAAAAGAGLDPDRLLLVPDPGPSWPQVIATLLDGCDLVLLRPPSPPSATLRRKLESVARRYGGVLVIAGDWDGAHRRLTVISQEWAGIGSGHGRAPGPPGPGRSRRPRRSRPPAVPLALAPRPRRLRGSRNRRHGYGRGCGRRSGRGRRCDGGRGCGGCRRWPLGWVAVGGCLFVGGRRADGGSVLAGEDRRMSLGHRTPGRVLVVCCPGLLAGSAGPDALPPVAGPAPAAPGPWPGAAGLAAPVTTAVARLPGSGELPGGPEFAQVVAAIEEFSPLVEVIGPGRCAISATAPARYFGGEQALLTKITGAITALGLTGQAAIADGLFAALLAAQATPAEPAASPEAAPPCLSAPPVTTAARVVSSAAAGSAVAAPAPPEELADPAAPPETASPHLSAPPVTAAACVASSAAASVPAASREAGGRAGLPGMIVPPGGTPAFLAGYPVSVLEVPELSSLLPRLGIWTLGDYARLPAAEAASRFGAAGAQAHRLARGLDPRPLVPRPPQADLSAGRDFEPPAGLSEPVVFAAKSLAEELHTRLAARGLACVRLRVEVAFADGRENIRLWRHDGLLSELAVAERVRWQLDSSPTDPAAHDHGGFRGLGHRKSTVIMEGPGWDGPAEGGIVRLRLVPDQLVRDTGRQLALWGETVISTRVARAATRVQAMLGSSAVTRPLLAGGRDPAEQVTLIPFGDAGARPGLAAARGPGISRRPPRRRCTTRRCRPR